MGALKPKKHPRSGFGLTWHRWRVDESVSVRNAGRAISFGLRNALDPAALLWADFRLQFVCLLGVEPLAPTIQVDRIVEVVYSARLRTLAVRFELSDLAAGVGEQELVTRFFSLAQSAAGRVQDAARQAELVAPAKDYRVALDLAENAAHKALTSARRV
jgi:hypothetical protein